MELSRRRRQGPYLLEFEKQMKNPSEDPQSSNENLQTKLPIFNMLSSKVQGLFFSTRVWCVVV